MAKLTTAELIAAAKERTATLIAAAQSKQVVTQHLPNNTHITEQEKKLKEFNEDIKVHFDKDGNTFNPFEYDGLILNEEQSQAVTLFGIEGKSGCLIGPAGTGKTTTVKAIIRAAIMSGRIPIVPETMVHKYLTPNLPGIYGGSFTRIATRNLRDNFPVDVKANVHTLHRFLEFEPEIYEVEDPETKKMKKVRVFKPTRHRFRTIHPSFKMFVIDESSMVGLTLDKQFREALQDESAAQILYIGDIAQLPPVMDSAILGYKMLEHLNEGLLIELKKVYRHAGSIVELANNIRVGNTIPSNVAVVPYLGNLRKLPRKLLVDYFTKEEWKVEADNKFSKAEDGSKVTILYWKTRLDGDIGQLKAMQQLGKKFFPDSIASGEYDPMKHMILMPYNKSVGTIEMNKYIAQYLGRTRNAIVFEVISGFEKHYFAVGDKVFYEREEAVITKILGNAGYAGRLPQKESVTLDRWGHDTAGTVSEDTSEKLTDIDALLNINLTDIEDRKNQASHVLYIRKLSEIEDGENEEGSRISTASEINSLLFGYALTIHKSQGSQWEKVYCIFHNSHNRNLQRELLYTGITRAQKELFIIAEPETFIQGVYSQHIQGNSLAEKAEYFKGKIEEDKEKQRAELFANNQKGK